MPQQTKEEQLRELRDEFYKFLEDDTLKNEDIFAWFATKLSSYKSELKERVENTMTDVNDEKFKLGYDKACDDIIQLIETK